MRINSDLHELLHQIGSGDSLALDALHDAIRRPLERFLSSRYSPKLTEDDIDDVIQYTMIQIWRYAPVYRGAYNSASAERWIFQIAEHRCWRMLSASNPRFVSLDSDDEDGSEDDDQISPYEYKLSATEDTEEQAMNA